MKRTECEKGHIYDADVYPACPYCGNFQTLQFGEKTDAGEVSVGQSGDTFPGSIPAGQSGETLPGGAFGESPGRVAADHVRTLPPRGYDHRVDEDRKTMGMMGRRHGSDPVVGWLVCIEGSEQGKDYRLYGRINTIGRDIGMDVCIHSDPEITREIHARIGYDPRHNNFHLIPANSSNNTYLNDEPVYIPTKLEAYDILEIGRTKLLFVPLCGRRFSWDRAANLSGGEEDATV